MWLQRSRIIHLKITRISICDVYVYKKYICTCVHMDDYIQVMTIHVCTCMYMQAHASTSTCMLRRAFLVATGRNSIYQELELKVTTKSLQIN